MDERDVHKLLASHEIQNNATIFAVHAAKCPKCWKKAEEIVRLTKEVVNHAHEADGI